MYNSWSHVVDAADIFNNDQLGGNNTSYSNATDGSSFADAPDDLSPYALLFPW
jgi:hypothetical protein